MYARLFHSEAAAPTRANLVAGILRATLAVVFLFHGLDKIIHHDGGTTWVNDAYGRRATNIDLKPEDQRTQVEEQLPVSMTFVGTQLAVAWGEFLGGLALAAGMLTRLAALGLILIQIGAVILVTAPRGFQFERGGGYEYNFVLIAACLSLVILGAGQWSVDEMLMKQRRKATQAKSQPAPMPSVSPSSTAAEPAQVK